MPGNTQFGSGQVRSESRGGGRTTKDSSKFATKYISLKKQVQREDSLGNKNIYSHV